MFPQGDSLCSPVYMTVKTVLSAMKKTTNKHFSYFSKNILKDHVNGKTTKTHTKSKHAVNYWNGLNWPNKQDQQHLKSTMWELCSSDIMVESKAAVLASPTPVCWDWLLRYQIKLKSKLLVYSELYIKCPATRHGFCWKQNYHPH